MLKKKNKNFYILIFIFFLLNLFVSVMANLKEYNEKIKLNNFIQLEVQSAISKEELSQLEKKIMSIKDVLQTKVYPKEQALENIEKELKIKVTEDENPIMDTIICYIKPEKIETITSQIEAEELNVKLYYNNEKIAKNMESIKKIQKVNLFFLLITVMPLYFLTLRLYKDMIEYHVLYFKFVKEFKNNMFLKAWKVSLIPMVLTAILGTGIYLIFYAFVENNVLSGLVIETNKISRLCIFTTLVTTFFNISLSRKK